MARTGTQGTQTRKSLFLALCALVLGATAPAHQNAHPQPAEPSAHSAPGAQEPDVIPVDLPVKDRQSLETLQAIFGSLSSKQVALEALDAQIRREFDQEQRTLLQEQAKELRQEIDRLKENFTSVATGIDFGTYGSTTGLVFNLREEVVRLLQPLIEEIKKATADPRQIEQLRMQLADSQRRQRMAADAIAQIERLKHENHDPSLSAALDAELADWQARLLDVSNQEAIARFQLDTKLEGRKSLIQSTRNIFSGFFRTRGLNLVLSLLAFCGVFFGLRALHEIFMRLSPALRRPERPFYVRLITVLYMVMVGALAVFAALLVLYVAGDWVLLGLALLFLLGLVWASRNTVPLFFEQIRILLNVGTVREQERVTYNGLPWLVKRLSFHTDLVNEALTGGTVRLGVRQLVGMTSRPCHRNEIWFPCQPNDWVLLSDGRRGRVVLQTPEVVQLQMLGGSLVTYQTSSFLALNPQNISKDFRLPVVFGIDYRHQAISTTTIPATMRKRLEKGLSALVGRDAISHLRVEFKRAAPSSLDFEVLVDFKGSVAASYEMLNRAIQSILVDTCNEMGWVIPFTQVTLHQAPPPAQSPSAPEEAPEPVPVFTTDNS